MNTIADLLLDIGAVQLRPQEPFTWSSGWKSPIYCDNRLTLSFPAVRTLIKVNLCELVKNHFPQTQYIAGVATAGIAQGALVADALSLPFIYVRPEPKKHGMNNMIEGKLEPGQSCVVVEDLISTGMSSLKVIEALELAGAQVLGVIAIMDYGFEQAVRNFQKKNLAVYSLTDYSQVIKRALERSYISSELIDSLEAWRKAPENWSASHTI